MKKGLDKEIQEDLSRCVRCGTCMAVCPVYLAAPEEASVARGKLSLLTAIPLGKHVPLGMRQTLSSCLLCNSCSTSCPNQVDTARIVQAARVELSRTKNVKRFWHWLIRFFLPSRRRMGFLMKTARATRLLWARKLPNQSGLHIRLARFRRKKPRFIPELAETFFLDRKLSTRKPISSKGPTVSLFVGCFSNYLRPQIAEAAQEVLLDLGARLVVPTRQVCCGLPAFGLGENETARESARQNLEAFLEHGTFSDYITTTCASCAFMLKKHLPELLKENPGVQDKAKDFSSRVIPISQLWVKLGGYSEKPLEEKSQVRLTYHDPCHLSRDFGEKDAPRMLLNSVSGVQFLEMDHPCKCCGHGGSFNFFQPELSQLIAQKKIDNLLKSGANFVATECSGCMLQLSEALFLRGSTVEVLSTIEAKTRFLEKSKANLQ